MSDGPHYLKMAIKYNGEVLKKGAEFVPQGGKFDAQIIEHKCFTPSPVQIARKARKAQREGSGVYICEWCGYQHEKQQGLSAHQRFCKERPE